MSKSISTPWPLWQKYATIAGLYLAQGLPGGLIAYTLPVLMRTQNVSQLGISLFSLVGIPWSIKLLWSRLLDQSPHKACWMMVSFVLTAVCWLGLSMQPVAVALAERQTLSIVVLLLLLANFVMASQDVLTDGLTVRILTDQERGLANSVQVVAYKLGMLISGGLFLSFYADLGWQSSMQLVVAVLAVAYLPLFYQLWHSRRAALHQALGRTSTAADSPTARKDSLLALLRDFVRLPGVAYWLLLLCVYKLPDGLVSTILRPFAVDYGMSPAIIGHAANYAIILGGLAGIGGGLLWHWQRHHYQKLLLLLALMQMTTNLGYYALTYLPHNPPLWWVLSLFEPMVDTMSTVILFATMMHYARKVYAGVDYTFQATLFVLAAGVMHLVGGWLTDVYGHRLVFVVAVALSALTVLLVLKPLKSNPEKSE